MNVLIVEDEKNLAEGLRFNLEAEGHEAEIAGDGEAALAHLNDSSFDVVVLDVMLPAIDGFEVARPMRATRRLHADADADRARAARGCAEGL